MFSGIGGGEWLVLLAVLLVVSGPKSLPGAVRSVGRWYARFRRMAENLRREILDMGASRPSIDDKFPQ